VVVIAVHYVDAAALRVERNQVVHAFKATGHKCAARRIERVGLKRDKLDGD